VSLKQLETVNQISHVTSAFLARKHTIFLCRGFAWQVVFSAVQLSRLSVEQAWAVTEVQWAELDTEQRRAVGLARYEGDVLLELRGVSS